MPGVSSKLQAPHQSKYKCSFLLTRASRQSMKTYQISFRSHNSSRKESVQIDHRPESILMKSIQGTVQVYRSAGSSSVRTSNLMMNKAVRARICELHRSRGSCSQTSRQRTVLQAEVSESLKAIGSSKIWELQY